MVEQYGCLYSQGITDFNLRIDSCVNEYLAIDSSGYMLKLKL